MSADQDSQKYPPESFTEQVKNALEHLYDLSYLQHHPLLPEIQPGVGQPAEIAGQRLRRELAAAIEALNPGKDVPPHTSSARLYNLLVLHYMQGITIRNCAYDLSISERQAYRGLRQGEQCVAEVLWSRRSTPNHPEVSRTQPATLQQALKSLNGVPRTSTDVYQLLQSALAVVAPLAAQRDVLVRASSPQEPVKLLTYPGVAEQLLIGVLSHAVEQSEPGPLQLSLMGTDEQLYLTLSYSPARDAMGTSVIDQLTAQLADRLEWTVKQEDLHGGERAVTLQMAVRFPTVLVIDDNEGLAELLERFLAGCPCHVVAALDGREGLRQAQHLAPKAIILDVMMPDMHGWQVLQRLQNHPRTCDIPVIVCSVITLPELAQSLGAAYFLAKPIRQDDVLDALRQLSIV
jgi:CheY-like chemotaxis protein